MSSVRYIYKNDLRVFFAGNTDTEKIDCLIYCCESAEGLRIKYTGKKFTLLEVYQSGWTELTIGKLRKLGRETYY